MPGSFDMHAIYAGQVRFPTNTAPAPVDCPDTHPFRGVGGQAIELMQTGNERHRDSLGSTDLERGSTFRFVRGSYEGNQRPRTRCTCWRLP